MFFQQVFSVSSPEQQLPSTSSGQALLISAIPGLNLGRPPKTSVQFGFPYRIAVAAPRRFMKFKIALFLIILLSGCATPKATVEKPVVKKPAALTEKTDKINKEKATAIFSNALEKMQESPIDAIGLFKEVITFLPESWEAHYNIGIIYLKLSDRERAEKEFRNALRQKGPAEKIYNALGNLYFDTGSNRKAISAFKKAMNFKKSPTTLINLANLYQMMDKKQKAIKYYAEANDIEPLNQILHYNKGILLYNMGKYETARKEFNKAVKSAASDIKIYQAQAQTLLKLGEYRVALKIFQKVIDMDPLDPTPYWNMGIIYEIYLGNLEKALESYITYIDRGGDNSKVVKAWIDVVKFRLSKGKNQDEG